MTRKQIIIAGSISFSFLFLLSILFYKERTVFTDIAFHIFYLAKEGDFAIQNNRFGAVFTQIFPLLAIKAGAPLHSIMMGYSVGFIIFYFALFILCAVVLKQRELSIIFLLFPVLFVSHTFYWIQSELPQGMAFMLLFFSFYRRYREKILSSFTRKLFLLILLVILSGYHPLLFIPLVFIAGFYLLSSPEIEKKEFRLLTVFAGLFIVLLFLKSVFTTNGYESTSLGGLKNFIRLFPNYFTIQSNKDFILNCFRLYYFLPVLLGVTIYHYYKKKMFRKLWLTVIFFFGYLLLINVCYFENAPAHYIENMYLPLSFFVLFPFVYDILPTFQIKTQIITVAFILFAGVVRIYFMHSLYTTRYNWEADYLEKNGDKKLFVDSKTVPLDTLIDIWATPYEFWLLSTARDGKSASIVVTDSIDNYYYWLPQNKVFFVDTRQKFYYTDFTTKYFSFTDTSKYIIRRAD